ncbi:MAG: hypothetical protein PHR50_15000 [Lachnospiraceae bacterium]|nr:hypothetical protein [Lachnospiraceae bacterium]
MIKDCELIQLAKTYQREHKRVLKEWRDGEVKLAWRDEENNLCVKYQSGNVYTYAENVDFETDEIVELEFW